MQSFNIKSVVLGVGIGIVLTSITGMIYSAGFSKKMNREEIIKEAAKYGMVQKSELLKGQGTASDVKQERTPAEESKAVNPSKQSESVIRLDESRPFQQALPKKVEESQQAASKPVNETVTITVSKGESSEVVADKLLKSGLISDKPGFIRELVAMGLATEIDIGEYKILKGADIKAIIKIITRR